jgi:hypothetical protein
VINAQGATDAWFFGSGQLAGHEFYLSYYDWGAGGADNEEYILAHPFQRTSSGKLGFETGFTLTASGTYNDPCPIMVDGSAQGVSQTPSYGFADPRVCYFTNAWTQWEIWFRGNTVGNSDGFIRIFKNGTAYADHENIQISGIDLTGMEIEVGGWYTKNVWTNNAQMPPSGSCSPGPGQGSEAGSWQGSFGSVGTGNCTPAPPVFTRYIDDIILLQK